MTIAGRQGEGRHCIANFIRHILEENDIQVDMKKTPYIEYAVAADVLRDTAVSIRVIETEETL